MLAWRVGIRRIRIVAAPPTYRVRRECADLQMIHMRGSSIRAWIHRERTGNRLSLLRERSLFPCGSGHYSPVLAVTSVYRAQSVIRRSCGSGHYSRVRAGGRTRVNEERPPSLFARRLRVAVLLAGPPTSPDCVSGRLVDGARRIVTKEHRPRIRSTLRPESLRYPRGKNCRQGTSFKNPGGVSPHTVCPC